MSDLPATIANTDPGTPTAPPHAILARRGLLGGAGVALGTALARPGTLPIAQAAAQAPTGAAVASAPTARPYAEALRRRTLEVREAYARAAAAVPVPPLPHNGDQERYPNKIGSDTRGLPHDARGEVDPAAWRAALAAYQSDEQAEFEKIPLARPL